MRSLSCVLIREGPSDDWFLPILLRRALEELVVEFFPACREVQEVRPLPEVGNQHPETMIKTLKEERGTFDVVLYHHDGAPPAKSQLVLGRIRQAYSASDLGEPLVPVVPMRETEAWVLADRTALVRALNLRRLNREPVSGSEAESCPDPKVVIDALLRDEAGLNPKKKGALRNFYLSVAENAGIAELRKVPAFQQWWNDMIEALEGLGYQHG